MQALDTILEAIGNTPIIKLNRVAGEDAASIYGKYEAGNPSYSVKDRIALAMIEDAYAQGKIKPSTLIVDATAGNTGVALAMVCAVKKLKLLLFMPEDASLERRKMFNGFGAKLVLTPQEEGVKGAIKRATQVLQENPDSYSPKQFENPVNPKAHAENTAVEILNDFPNGVDALVLGVGTGGSLTGVGSVLKKKNKNTLIVAVEPKKSAVISGGRVGPHQIQQLGVGFIPKNLDKDLIDRVLTVDDVEAFQMTKRLAQEEGMLLGISSGANVCAALKIAKELGPKKNVLTFLADAGQRYFSIERYFKE